MSKFLPTILAIFLVAGCTNLPQKPVIQYETQLVNVPVPVFPAIPDVAKFESRVMMLTDDSADGEVGKAYKQDWLSLMLRDRLFTQFLDDYRKAKESVQSSPSKPD